MATKLAFIGTKLFSSRDKINDVGIRVILVPLFGIGIPLLSRMVPFDQFNNWQIKFSFLYTIGIAFVIYEGSRFLYLTLRTYFDWFQKPLRKLMALVLSIPFYVIPAAVLMQVGWYHIFLGGNINWSVIWLNSIIILIAVFFLVNLYETVFLVRDMANERVLKEQLERARVEAELEALKNQVDPHFIFNSLNTLAHLIESKPEKAQLFNENLADVYRYILHNKARDLVFMKEEIQFIENYFSLLNIRFEKAVQLELDIPEDVREKFLIPPISLQTLIENAVKHNEFTDEKPLQISIRIVGNELWVCNPYQPKSLRKPSSRIGLLNLNERYRLSTGKEIVVENTEAVFCVKLPLLN